MSDTTTKPSALALETAEWIYAGLRGGNVTLEDVARQVDAQIRPLVDALESLVNECRMEEVEGHYDAQGYDFAGCLTTARAALAKVEGGAR